MVVVVVVDAVFFFSASSLNIFNAVAAIDFEDISLSVRKLSPEVPPLLFGFESN